MGLGLGLEPGLGLGLGLEPGLGLGPGCRRIETLGNAGQGSWVGARGIGRALAHKP